MIIKRSAVVRNIIGPLKQRLSATLQYIEDLDLSTGI